MIMKGKEEIIWVAAKNAASYQWQMKVKRRTPTGIIRMWKNIDDDSSTLNQFSFTQFRCAVTGKNGDVIYSESVKVTQKFNACIIIDFRTGGSPDDTITVKFDKYTPGGVYKSSFTDEIVHKNATLYYYQTGTGKYVITVSKP